MNRIQEKYKKVIVPELMKKFRIGNAMQVPAIRKVIVHVGTGKMSQDKKISEKVGEDLAKITGQKPVIRPAKKSIAGFKLREGMPVGLMVTLRAARMYDFIDRLISVALPRSRDFQGLSPETMDKAGNLNIGIKEHSIFPEVSYESLRDVFGLQVTIVTKARNRDEALELLRMIGFPLKK